ncbi:hypothetical protein M3197_15730 [Sporosarcina aquimarina]|uniref:hypothetical protein n=1 Tax=Sporosarcina aquimarina TaxID=114975 RepID=UPI0020425539|nr:hypothetical protein [Sporosarcina aquimarina]MCM3758891.1 hypothetical protein [Sporosarcina aquimarina]
MKGKTIVIAVIVLTIVAVAAIYFLVMATFKHDQQSVDSSVDTSVSIEWMEQQATVSL